MNSSSNIDMKQVFEHLENIKEVEPSINLYSQTLNRLNRHNVIPLYWVKAVACLFILFFSSEFYIFYIKNSSKQDILTFVSTTNNILYNE